MLEQAWKVAKSNLDTKDTADKISDAPANSWFLGSIRLLLINSCISLGLTQIFAHYTIGVIALTLAALLCISILRVSMDSILNSFYVALSPSVRMLWLIALIGLNLGFVLTLNTIWQSYQLNILLLLSLGLEYFLPTKIQNILHHKVLLFSIEAFHEVKKVKFKAIEQVVITTGIVLTVLGLLFGIVKSFNILISSFLKFFLA
jgi:preprotein translocase subunit SecE